MAKHWTQTAEGRKRMSAIGKKRHAAKTTSIPLDAIPERPRKTKQKAAAHLDSDTKLQLIKLILNL